jgi:Na+-transporting NADH:ubiquinone oxidoreductase subunit NqrC
MRFKQIIIIIVVIQLFSVISITGFYYMISPLQNCLRLVETKFNDGDTYDKTCFDKTSW